MTRIAGERNRGQDGWVYKVGRRAGTAGAADAAGPFGNGRGCAGATGAVVLVRRAARAAASGRSRPRPDRRAAAPGETMP